MASPIVLINGTPLWDGSRDLTREYIQVAETRRSLDGTLHIAVSSTPKVRLELRWNYLPNNLVGFHGRKDLRDMYLSGQPLEVRVYESDTTYRDLEMIIPPGEYREAIVFRAGGQWVWSVTLALEEI